MLAWWLDADNDELDGRLEQLVTRGHEDGSIDREMDAAWIEAMLWAGLWSANQLANSGTHLVHEVREICTRTLVKIIRP